MANVSDISQNIFSNVPCNFGPDHMEGLNATHIYFKMGGVPLSTIVVMVRVVVPLVSKPKQNGL